MSMYEMIVFMCPIVSLLSTILIGVWQILQNRRVNKLDMKRHDDMLYSEATKFILKYSAPEREREISLLPLCVIAYKYDPIYPYCREIYREFCILSEDLQAVILRRCNISLETGRCDNFFGAQITFLKSVIEINYPGDKDIFYERAKYFKNAVTVCGACERPNITCAVDSYLQAAYDDGTWIGEKSESMPYDEHITNLLAYEKTMQPISRLFVESTSMGTPNNTSNGTLISYLCCQVAKYATCYSCDCDRTPNIMSIDGFSGICRMEDLFLEALLHIYCFGGHTVDM